MKTSRQRLLLYLDKKQVATVRDISLALKMTPSNARHHLSILVEQGSVEITGKLAGQSRGRPYKLYRPAKPARRDNLNELTQILFQELFEGKNAGERDNLLIDIAYKIIKYENPPSIQQSKRLNEAIHRLNQMNYNARWEAHRESPHVIFENCPYRGIVDDFPEICRMDKHLLEKMLGLPVSQIAKLELTKSGLNRCVFVLDAE